MGRRGSGGGSGGAESYLEERTLACGKGCGTPVLGCIPEPPRPAGSGGNGGGLEIPGVLAAVVGAGCCQLSGVCPLVFGGGGGGLGWPEVAGLALAGCDVTRSAGSGGTGGGVGSWGGVGV